MLKLDALHTIYWEQSGHEHGTPVAFLHGGPGAGATPTHRRFFDPQHYRIVIFDQRGAGRSTPLGAVAANTTRHIVADLEALRRHLGIARRAVLGGSWACTKPFASAETRHPRCI